MNFEYCMHIHYEKNTDGLSPLFGPFFEWQETTYDIAWS